MDRHSALAAEARIINHFSLAFGALHPYSPHYIAGGRISIRLDIVNSCLAL